MIKKIADKKIGIVGYGFVGKATHHGLLDEIDLLIHDIALGTKMTDLESVDVVFFCIPTDDDSDIENLKREILELKQINKSCQIIIRSTVPIGTCLAIEELLEEKIVYIPEFLRERFWKQDCVRRPLIVGHNGIDCDNLLDGEHFLECSTTEAEIIKMFSNNFGVLKIAFANLFYDISQTVGANYEVVNNLYFNIAHDQTYTNVPGPDGSRGFGGKCLPKDLDFLINTLDDLKLNSEIFKIIRKLNEQWLKY